MPSLRRVRYILSLVVLLHAFAAASPVPPSSSSTPFFSPSSSPPSAPPSSPPPSPPSPPLSSPSFSPPSPRGPLEATRSRNALKAPLPPAPPAQPPFYWTVSPVTCQGGNLLSPRSPHLDCLIALQYITLPAAPPSAPPPLPSAPSFSDKIPKPPDSRNRPTAPNEPSSPPPSSTNTGPDGPLWRASTANLRRGLSSSSSSSDISPPSPPTTPKNPAKPLPPFSTSPDTTPISPISVLPRPAPIPPPLRFDSPPPPPTPQTWSAGRCTISLSLPFALTSLAHFPPLGSPQPPQPPPPLAMPSAQQIRQAAERIADTCVSTHGRTEGRAWLPLAAGVQRNAEGNGFRGAAEVEHKEEEDGVWISVQIVGDPSDRGLESWVWGHTREEWARQAVEREFERLRGEGAGFVYSQGAWYP